MATVRDTCFVILAILTLISFLTVQIISYTTMSKSHGGGSLDDTDLNPPGWAFSIWFIIYLWQFSWMIYVLTTLCRQVGGKPVYQQLHVISIPFLLIYIVNMALNVVFFYVYICPESGTLIPVASVASIWMTAVLCLGIFFRNIDKVPEKVENLLRNDLISLVVLVQNGLAIYVSWCTLANMLCLNSFLVYTLEIPMSTSSPLVLTILAVIVVFYFIVDIGHWKGSHKYTFSFYPALMWGLLAITIDKFDSQSLTSIYVLVLLVVLTVFFVVKIVVMVIRARKTVPPETYAAVF